MQDEYEKPLDDLCGNINSKENNRFNYFLSIVFMDDFLEYKAYMENQFILWNVTQEQMDELFTTPMKWSDDLPF